jgi:hypothetical protein
MPARLPLRPIATAVVLAIAATSMCGTASRADSAPQNLAFVELYTSQGCSSCPPADRLFPAYADRTDIVAVTFPVDYWDYLGWKDTLASPKFSKRQRDLSRSRGDGAVYTPQIVVNGARHMNGSDRRAIDAALAATVRPVQQASVVLRCRSTPVVAAVQIAAQGADKRSSKATVWLAVVRPSVEIAIKRGENSGRTVKYANVVQELSPIGMWTGEPLTIELSRKSLNAAPESKLAVFVQDDVTGAVVAASWLTTRFGSGS